MAAMNQHEETAPFLIVVSLVVPREWLEWLEWLVWLKSIPFAPPQVGTKSDLRAGRPDASCVTVGEVRGRSSSCAC